MQLAFAVALIDCHLRCQKKKRMKTDYSKKGRIFHLSQGIASKSCWITKRFYSSETITVTPAGWFIPQHWSTAVSLGERGEVNIFSCLPCFRTVLYCAHVRIRSLMYKLKRSRCWDGGQASKRVSGVDTVEYLLVEYIFTAYLLCAGHCSRGWGFRVTSSSSG